MKYGSKFSWSKASEAGDIIQAKTAPIPGEYQRRIADALERAERRQPSIYSYWQAMRMWHAGRKWRS